MRHAYFCLFERWKIDLDKFSSCKVLWRCSIKSRQLGLVLLQSICFFSRTARGWVLCEFSFEPVCQDAISSPSHEFYIVLCFFFEFTVNWTILDNFVRLRVALLTAHRGIMVTLFAGKRKNDMRHPTSGFILILFLAGHPKGCTQDGWPCISAFPLASFPKSGLWTHRLKKWKVFQRISRGLATVTRQDATRNPPWFASFVL